MLPSQVVLSIQQELFEQLQEMILGLTGLSAFEAAEILTLWSLNFWKDRYITLRLALQGDITSPLRVALTSQPNLAAWQDPRNPVAMAALYAENVLISDPVHKLAMMRHRLGGTMLNSDSSTRIDKSLMAAALQLLAYKEGIHIDNKPFLIFSPDPLYMTESVESTIRHHVRDDIRKHFSVVLDRNFYRYERCDTALRKLETPLMLEKAAIKRDRILLLTEPVPPSIAEQLESAGAGISWASPERVLDGLSAGKQAEYHTNGFFAIINELLVKSSMYDASPVTTSETLWKYLIWKFEYDGVRDVKPDTALARVLLAGTDRPIHAIGNVSLEDVVSIREAGGLAELRAILMTNANALATANADQLERVGESVSKNIQHAFEEHQRDVDLLVKKGKSFFGFALPAFVGRVMFAFAAPIAGDPVFSAFATAVSLTGIGTLKETYKQWREIAHERQKLALRPTGILMKYWDE